MNMPRGRSLLALSLLLGGFALVLAPAASAQNLVTNGDFATDLAEWDDIDAETWSSEDAAGDPASGSMLVNNSSGPNTGVYALQCIAVDAGQTYTFGASHLSEGTGTTGQARVDLRFWGSADCSADDLTLHRIESAATGDWFDLEGGATAPDDAVSASVSLVAFKSTGQLFAPWSVAFDDVFVVVPEADAFAASASALGALLVLRRRS
jgi:hypothetical protein